MCGQENNNEPSAQPTIEADVNAGELSDESYAESSAASFLSTIASEIKKGREENGRIYPSYGTHEYGMPIDERELDRQDMQHYKYTLLQGGKLHLSPLLDNVQKILDIGTGTGIWAIDMAEKFPSAEVIGTDIAPVQPTWVPPNCSFEVDDCELEWAFPTESFDLIHSRDLYLGVRDWPRLVKQCYDHLKPGGYIEFACVHSTPHCDDGTMGSDSAYAEVCNVAREFSEAMGATMDTPRLYGQYFKDAGFVDVSENRFKIPNSDWPKDKVLKKIGALERLNLIEGGEGFLLRGFTKELGRSRDEMELLLMRMRKEIMANRSHGYVNFYVTYGRKPPQPADS